MTIRDRLILALGALLLVPAFWLPLWSIRIVAPQYREGLGMYIGLRDIWGHTPHDIQNINILNHYIGMKAIDPEVVGVLTIMPWVVGLLIVSGLAVALAGRRSLVIAWLVTFAVLGAAGLYEFWSWKYDYGHNLSPMAPIKIPGMTYQPPLLGTKQLLNMTTTSFPSWGTLLIGLAFLSGILAIFAGRWRTVPGLRTEREPRPKRVRRSGSEWASVATAIVLLAVIGGCAPAPGSAAQFERAAETFPVGAVCDYCEGAIPEARFGGELTTTDGATYRFMSVECLAGFVVSRRVEAGAIASVRVVDYNHGEQLIDAAEARYVKMQWERSPNGLNLAAVPTDRLAANLRYFLGGEQLTWAEVLEYVKQEWEL